MAIWRIIGVIGMIVAGAAAKTELPPLPEWDPEDLEKVKSGEIIPGNDLFREDLEDLVLPVPPPVVPAPETLTPEPEPEVIEELPTVIPERFHAAYFGQRTAAFLVDPQELLSRQEYRDRESFLEYHAGDSEVNLYIYLFDAEQELPEGVTIDMVFRDHFTGAGPTALVFYYLGMPARTEMMLSEDIREAISKEERVRALRTAVEEAFEKSDPAYQLDNFSVELSIRLYWFEKAMAGPVAVASEGGSAAEMAQSLALTQARERRKTGIEFLMTGLWILGVLVLAAGLGWAGRIIALRRVRYIFPEVEVDPLLGAPHAAGVGAVISFSSAQLPPSQQRDQVPDYIHRM